MKPGYDARRRNRNIGTAKSGHGQDNRQTIPSRWSEDRVFYEVLTDPKVVVRDVNNRQITFLVEPVREGSCHPCTIDDIVSQLRSIPVAAQRGIEIYILRQPTRKQQLLRSVWGRFAYWANLGRYTGSAVVLEAQEVGPLAPGLTLRWGRALSVSDQQELERLRQDGHEVSETKREYQITISLDSARATQLYRTLPHEIGHNVHYLEEVEDRVGSSLSREELEAAYYNKPSAEREAYAHRFADSLRNEFLKRGKIPFERIENTTGMKREGLDPQWFGV